MKVVEFVKKLTETYFPCLEREITHNSHLIIKKNSY